VDDDYYRALQAEAAGLPVELIVGANRSTVESCLAQSKVFWHAAGFGVDENESPNSLEHFGIVTVEAMAAGCIPVVYAKGGQREIVEHGVSGFHWTRIEDLQAYTEQLANDEALCASMSDAARRRAKVFAKENFIAGFERLLSPRRLNPASEISSRQALAAS
jgi:glycosyltransferase involved in cell wall biosynthesis